MYVYISLANLMEKIENTIKYEGQIMFLHKYI